ncbi:MAG: hypothetical protein HC850_11900 [Rhodomicrobium sp.]|nr:hypothetical protein [Rhodomicrobium sp.]
MKCPVDGEALTMSDRNGVEIDYCPKCRGVWLDRGELDKIIERQAALSGGPASREGDRGYDNRQFRYGDDDDDDDYDRRGQHPQGRRRGFLGDIFDF